MDFPARHLAMTGMVTLMAAAGTGCDTVKTPCEGADAACACEVDEDCVITVYHSPVSSEADCYDLEACCPGDGLPLNADEATTHELSWDDAGCVNGFDASICDECDNSDSAWVECQSGRCVKFFVPGPPPRYNE